MKRKIIVLFLLFCTPFAVKAQYKSQVEAPSQESPTLSLSLDEAVNYALEHNRTLMNASLDVRAAEAQKWQAIASMLPQVSLSGDYQDMFGYKMKFGPGLEVALPSSLTMGVSAAVAFSGTQVVSAIISKISKDMSDVSLKKSEQTIRDGVKNLYYSALASGESIDLLKSSLESLTKLYHFTKKSVEVGVAEETDADQLLVQVASLQNTVRSTERTLEVLHNTIKLQLGLSPEVEIVLTDNIEHLVDEASAIALLNENFDKKRNYDWMLLKKSVDLSKKQIQLAGWQNGPSLAVAYQYSYKKTFGDGMNMTPPNTLAVSLKIPIFTSLAKTKQIQAAKIAYQKQLNTLADTENALDASYKQLRYNLASALEQYHTQRSSVEISTKVYNNISRKYELGAASALDVTNATTSVINAQTSYVQTLLSLIDAQVSLESLLNK